MIPAQRTVLTRYRAQQEQVRAAVAARIAASYARAVGPDDISASIDAVAAQVAPVIAGAQTAAQRLAGGYFRASAFVQAGTVLRPVATAPRGGTTAEGKTLAEGMAAIGPLVLGQIGAGRDVREALEYGAYLFERFADSEVVAAADAELETQREEHAARIVGWEGVVSPGACDNCQAANEGAHSIDEELYRHGNCGCTQTWLFG